MTYDPKDVTTWTPEQKREAFERQMRDRDDKGPLIVKTKEDIEAVIREMKNEDE